jgi:SagB-type dehydrogenase family enzyme
VNGEEAGVPAATNYVRTVRLAPLVYGEDGVPLDDPAELYHEASKIYPSFGARQTRGYLLEANEELRFSSARSVKRSRHLPAVTLPEPALPQASFGDVVNARRSERCFGAGPVSLEELSGLLHAAYGTTHPMIPDAPPGIGPLFRTVPSGGGLYPLELDAFAWNVHGLERGRYHFDPLRRVLEVIRVADEREAMRSTTVYEDIVTGCAVLVVISAMFWRTRFKYGLRGYRFALIEAGHVAQNVLLAATAFDLACVPLGGFFDREMDDLLGLDGVNESALYAVAIARRMADGP